MRVRMEIAGDWIFRFSGEIMTNYDEFMVWKETLEVYIRLDRLRKTPDTSIRAVG
jgi:hypothetical protein